MSVKWCSILAILLLFTAAGTAGAQPGTRYVGQLDPDGLPTMTFGGVRLSKVDPGHLPGIPKGFAASHAAYAGQFEWEAAGRGGKVSVVVVEPTNGSRYACLDLDGDGTYQTSECAVFVPGQQEDASDPEIRMSVPARVRPLRRLPLVVTWPSVPANKGPAGPEREIAFTGAVYVRGSVEIAGRRTQVTLRASLSKGGLIDPRNTTIGIDADGNGKIDPRTVPLEATDTQDEDLVFKVGDRFVLIRSVDPGTGSFTVEERPASEYIVIDRAVGATVPDFAFVDFSGERRHLSDYAGHVVLLDFWGTWCGPCVAEIPNLAATYEALHHRGLEIIGLNIETPSGPIADVPKNEARARKFIESHTMPWIQATEVSVRDLALKRFRVPGFPTTILIGRDGRIVSVGAGRELRGDKLLPTIEAAMGAR